MDSGYKKDLNIQITYLIYHLFIYIFYIFSIKLEKWNPLPNRVHFELAYSTIFYLYIR